MKYPALPLLALLLSACGGAGTPDAPASAVAELASPSETGDAEAASQPSGPDLSTCKPYGPEEYRDRKASPALKFPPRFAGIVATRPDQLAVLTLSGKTLCSDARWHDRASNPTLSADGRFVGYEWDGYEAFGYMLIDRSGAGVAIETGDKPVPSPSGKRLASVQWSESGFEAFSGAMILETVPGPLRIIGKVENLPEGLTDWRFDHWRNDGCFELSSVRFEDIPDDGQITPKTVRQRFIAREVNAKWSVEAFDACPAK